MGDQKKQKPLALGRSKGGGKVAKSVGKSGGGEVDEAERIRAEKEFLEAHGRRLSTPRTPPEALQSTEEGAVGGVDPKQVESELSESARESDVDEETGKKRQRQKSKTPPVKKKVKTTDEEEVETEEELRVESDIESAEPDPLKTVERALARVLVWGKDLWLKKRVFGRSKFEVLEAIVERAKGAIGRVREDQARVEGRLLERQEILSLIRDSGTRKGPSGAVDGGKPDEDGSAVETYSAVAQKKIPRITGVKKAVQGPPKELFIKKTGKDAEEVRTELKGVVDPKVIGVKVRKLMKRRGGVVVQVEDEEDLEKLKNCERLIESGMTIEKAKRNTPVVMIYDIDSKEQESDSIKEIYDKNVKAEKITFEDFLKEFKVRHKREVDKSKRIRAKGEKKENWVVECSGRVRNELRKTDRIYIGWECCRIKDYVDLAQCFKCLKFGHVAKHCRGLSACLKCAGRHERKDCKDANYTDYCINCQREGKMEKCDHAGNSRECPVYKRERKRYFEGVDYGSDEVRREQL